jgi:hypothetical protein
MTHSVRSSGLVDICKNPIRFDPQICPWPMSSCPEAAGPIVADMSRVSQAAMDDFSLPDRGRDCLSDQRHLSIRDRKEVVADDVKLCRPPVPVIDGRWCVALTKKITLRTNGFTPSGLAYDT